MSKILISNRDFRRTLLNLNGLSPVWAGDLLPSPDGALLPHWVDLMVQRLGFVQVDSVMAVERPQNHILFTRNRQFRQEMLRRRLEDARSLFENWTHDAAILPSRSYPYWKHYFKRVETFEAHPGYRRYFAPVTKQSISKVRSHVRKHGPTRPREIDSHWVDFGQDSFPAPTIAKITMELLWRTGVLAVCGRHGNEKVYDLGERVIPDEFYRAKVSQKAYLDWACRESLQRLGAATPTMMARFYDAISRQDALDWCRHRLGKELVPVEVEHADRTRSAVPVFVLDSMLERLTSTPAPPRRLRLLNPFDPLIHDRQRTRRIFGFDYRIEIFVPPKKRQHGYYVLPILEGERFTGRIDTKADRKKGELVVLGLWWEPGVKAIPRRNEQLERELHRLANFTGTEKVVFTKGYLKS